MTVFTKPGDVVLVESPTYNLALGIIRDHPVELAGVPLDAEGLDVVALAPPSRARGRGPARAPALHHPDLSQPRRRLSQRRAARASARARRRARPHRRRGRRLPRARLRGPAPPSLWALDREAPVIRLGSFSKTLAPGLRVGWTNARADLLESLAGMGMLESGGGVSHFGAQRRRAGARGVRATTSTLASCATPMRRAATRSRPRCASTCPPGAASPSRPAASSSGSSSRRVCASALLPAAEAHGVAFAPGARFCLDGDERLLRLAFSLYAETALARAPAASRRRSPATPA